MELSMLSSSELASELGARVRSERIRQNLTQAALAKRAGVSRLTVLRLEDGGSVTLTNFLAVLAALRRADDLDRLLAPPKPTTIEQFVGETSPARRRVRS